MVSRIWVKYDFHVNEEYYEKNCEEEVKQLREEGSITRKKRL